MMNNMGHFIKNIQKWDQMIKFIHHIIT